MELRHLRYFVVLATELNFTRAARKLRIAQPALSTQIADLEREIGTPLLFRTKRVVELTPAGVVFFEDARTILDASDKAVMRAIRTARGEVGSLSIGFFAGPVISFLPNLIKRYRDRYPNVSIRMRELSPERQLSAIATGEIDVGLTRPLPAGYQNLTHEVLFHEPLFVAVTEHHPLASKEGVSLVEFEHDPFLLLDRSVAPGLNDHILAACRNAGFSPHIISTPDLMLSILTMVSAGMGVSIVPNGTRNLGVKNVTFVPLSPPLIPVPLIISWKAQGATPTCEAFVQLVRERIPAIRAEVGCLDHG
jgi:DNA-binding transcriptional LysR family regulator